MLLAIKKSHYEIGCDFFDTTIDTLESKIPGSSLVYLLLSTGVRSPEILCSKLNRSQDYINSALNMLIETGFLEKTNDIMILHTRVSGDILFAGMGSHNKIIADKQADKLENLGAKAIAEWNVNDFADYFCGLYAKENAIPMDKKITGVEKGMLKNFVEEYGTEQVYAIITHAVKDWGDIMSQNKAYCSIQGLYANRSKIRAAMHVKKVTKEW